MKVSFVTPDAVTSAADVTVVSAVPLSDGRVRVTVGAELDGPLQSFTAWQVFDPDSEVELRERAP